MKEKYIVTIIEEHKYYIEVEANNEDEAEELAWQSDDFSSSNFDDTDSWVEQVENTTDKEIIWD